MMAAKKLDPELVNIIKGFGGDEAILISQELYNLEYEITDEDLHSKTGVKINQVRKILYILNDVGLTQLRGQRQKPDGMCTIGFMILTITRRRFYLEKRKS